MVERRRRDRIDSGLYYVSENRYFAVVGELGQIPTYFFRLRYTGGVFNFKEDSLMVVPVNIERLNRDWFLSLGLVRFSELEDSVEYLKRDNLAKQILRDHMNSRKIWD